MSLLLILSLVSLKYIDHLKVKYDIGDYFPKGDTILDDYNFFTRVFGYDDNKIWIAATDKESVFKDKFISECSNFQLKLEALSNVRNVQSLLSLKEKIKTPLGFVNIPFIHRDPSYIIRDSMRIMNDPRLTGNFIDKYAKSISFYLTINRAIPEDTMDHLIDQLVLLCNESNFHRTYLTGDRYTRYLYKNMIRQEMWINMLLCIIVIILFLFMTLRSGKGIFILVLTAIFSVIIFFGIIGFSSGSLGIMSNYYPIILIIIGLTTGIHILIKYENESRSIPDQKIALLSALKRIGYTTFLSALTTSVGFLTLNLSPILPIRQFGNEAALAVIISYLVSIFFIPAMIVSFRLGGEKLIYKKYYFWKILSNRFVNFLWVNEKLVIGIFVALLIFSFIGIKLISSNNYLVNSNASSKLLQEREFFETNYAGLRNLEILIEANPPTQIRNLETIRFFDHLESYLSSLYSVDFVISPASIYKSINKSYEGGRALGYCLPATEERFNKYNKYYNQTATYFGPYISDSCQVARISARVKDVGRIAANELHRKIYHWINANKKELNLSFSFTGIPILIDKTHEIMVNDLYKSLLIAFTIVSLMFGFLFKRLKFILISWIVNLFPLFIAAGVMGIFSIPLIAPTSIIFTIGYVIAVDDTIHFISNFQLNKKMQMSTVNSLKLTMNDTGKPMILTSIILIAGFSILIFSEFDVLYYNGILVSIIVGFAVITDIFLIPAMIKCFEKNNGR